MRRSLTVTLLLGLALLASACGGGSTGSEAGTDFSGTTIEGEELALADYAGDDRLLWFWAPW